MASGSVCRISLAFCVACSAAHAQGRALSRYLYDNMTPAAEIAAANVRKRPQERPPSKIEFEVDFPYLNPPRPAVSKGANDE
jgi:hypothetical protein